MNKSGRGGRGGFRGRGRGWGSNEPPPPPQTERVDYPAWSSFGLQLPAFKALNAEKNFFLMDREFIKEFRQSPYYLDVQKPKPEIERYSDKYKQKSTNKKTLRNLPTGNVYDPSKKTTKTTKKKLGLNLDALQVAEERENEKEDGEEDDEENVDEEIDDSDNEDEGDYQENYYDDDHDAYAGDSDGGGKKFCRKR
ncbi:hypothetical protein HK098_005601 [Nowakowskiella sp. JEL0407]|nr:hypothetical protein HK098_005601 [Nowakowskiella sp. JEL0407]